MVNILIAIVTGEYAKAQESSTMLFARARLEAAARQGETIDMGQSIRCPNSYSYFSLRDFPFSSREYHQLRGRSF